MSATASPLWTCTCGAVNLFARPACEACGLVRAGHAPPAPEAPARVYRHNPVVHECEVKNCTHPDCRAFVKQCMAKIHAMSDGMTYGGWRGKDRPPGLLERMGAPGHGRASRGPEDHSERIEKAAALIAALERKPVTTPDDEVPF